MCNFYKNHALVCVNFQIYTLDPKNIWHFYFDAAEFIDLSSTPLSGQKRGFPGKL